MGFANSIIGGAAKLIRAAIQSPNFVHNSAGWSINKDGSAEFSDITARGSIEASSISNTPIGSSTITNSDFQGGTMEETKITFDNVGGLLLVYATVVASQTFTATGTSNWTAPVGLVGGTVTAEVWGAGAGGGGSFWDAQGFTVGCGGGGEYAKDTVPVTIGNIYAAVVGTGGTGGTDGGPDTGHPGTSPTSGGTSTFTGDGGFVVRGHGGKKDGTPGTGSTNAVHFDGGFGIGSTSVGANGGSIGGDGGASSGGTSSSGSGENGFAGSGTGLAALAAPAGGGKGGNGGNASNPGGPGSNGAQPGGAGGSAGSPTHAGGGVGTGGQGGNGQVKLSWTTSKTLIGVIAPAAGTDSGGTAYPQGIAGIHAGTDYAALSDNGSNAALLFGASGSSADVSLTRSGAGKLLFTGTELDLPAASGPFIAGESFHTVSNGTNLTGTIRVKLLPWNAVWLDINVSDSSATAAAITCGSLPSASYYPTASRIFPLAWNGSPSSLGTVNGRVTIPTSGAITITTVTVTGAPVSYSCSVIYPTN